MSEYDEDMSNERRQRFIFMSKVNECYLIGVDIEEDTDISTLVVIKRNDERLDTVNTFVGKEAEVIYKKLTTPSKGIDTGLAGAQCYYEILKEKWKDVNLLYEDSIVNIIGYRGLRVLEENRYIACCRSSNGRRSYMLCNRSED